MLAANCGLPARPAAAYRGYTAYFGTYGVDEARNVIVHKVDGSLYPNFEGTAQQRRYTFSGDRLTLEADLPRGHATLVWMRLS